MTNFKKFSAIALTVSLLLPLAGCEYNFTFVDGYSFTYKGEKAERSDEGDFEEGITSIKLVNSFGDITIVESTDEPKWKWDGACWAETTEQADSFLDDLVLSVSTENNIQTFEIILPDSSPDLRGVKSNLTLAIPKSVAVNLENKHGNVDLQDISETINASNRHGKFVATNIAAATIHNEHGNTSINTVSGELDVKGAHGDIVAESLSASAKIDNSHGNITVTRAVDISATGSHSSVKLSKIDGDVDVSNRHGNIHIVEATGAVVAGTTHAKTEIETSGKTVKVKSSHGNVLLKLTGKNLIGVNAETTHGNITVVAPELESANIESKTTHGKVSSEIDSDEGSTTFIRLNNQHGNINVKR